MRYMRRNKTLICANLLARISDTANSRQYKLAAISVKGFTLIELLIVSVMIPIVAFAIYASFNNGVKIWQRINKEIPGEDLNIFFDKFALDLRNSFKFSGIKFSGKKNAVGFASIINSQRMQKVTVGEVIYSYDSKNSVLTREQKDFSNIYSNEKGAIRQLLKGVKSARFRYYFYDAQNKEYFWDDEWLKEGLPLSVRVELEIEQGNQINKFIRTVSIPVSG